MADDDLAEMAALRRSSKFQTHLARFGDRTAAKKEKEKEEQRLLSKMEVEREKRERDAQQRKAEIAKATEEMRSLAGASQSAGPGSAALGLPTEFGAKKEDSSNNHRKRQREQLTGSTTAATEADIAAAMQNIKDYKLPVTNEIVLAHGTRVLSALALDQRGGRLLTGGFDYNIKMWDFAGMTSTLQSFREVEPEEGHVVRQLRYCGGGKFLCITGYRCASIFTRDGLREMKCNRGDMYIHDLQHTVGHVAALTDGHWNPRNDNEFLTSSEDGTMRIWDAKIERRSKEYMKLKPRSGGRRTPVTSCCFSPDGSMIAAAGKMGSVQIWERKGSRVGVRAKKKVFDAHEPQTETSCVKFATDNRALVSRGGDGVVKLWDVRKFRKPVATWDNLPNLYSTSDLDFSPRGDLIIVGTSNPNEKEGTGQGNLVFLNRKKKKEIQRIRICQSSVIRVLWNARLNQIFCACADGATRVLYDPGLSRNGALLCIKKKARKKSAMDFSVFQNIKNPNALPLFAETQNPKRLRQKKRADPLASKKPLEPVKGQGAMGRIGNHNLTTHLMQCLAKREVRRDDPRDALLAYDDKAKADPMFYGNAYKHTQPKAIFADADEDEDQEESAKIKEIKKKIASAPLGADPESYRKEWK